MKQFELNGKTILFVEVPSEATEIDVIEKRLFYTEKEGIDGELVTAAYIGLGWDFLCLSKDMTDELAKTIMPSILTFDGLIYKDFICNNFEKVYSLYTALESFRSFEQSVGIVSVNPYEKSDECTCHICSEYCNWCEDDFDGIEYNEAQNEVKNYAILIK